MIGIDDIIATGLKIIDKVIPDPTAKAEAQLKLQELVQSGQLKAEEFDVQREKIAADDRDSARKMQSETHSQVPATLAAITIAGFFAVIGYILSGTLVITGEQGIMVGSIVGYVSAAANQVLSYYFGSSSTSKAKDATIHEILTK